MDFLLNTLAEFFQQSYPELIAVALSLVYLILIMRENIWAWPCALVSTTIYVWVFWGVSLFMESMLNVYYMAMAIYGFWNWQKKSDTTNQRLKITRWPLHRHAIAIGVLIIVSIISGYSLSVKTAAAWPYLDSFTTWGAVFTTYLVAQKVFENWLYWLVIDSIALILYLERGLYPTALLMALYLVLVFFGIFAWLKQMRSYKQVPETLNAAG